MRLLGVSKHTIEMYLCRAEFAHVVRRVKKGVTYYDNVTMDDVRRLQFLVENRRL
jgi:hypothetical protein